MAFLHLSDKWGKPSQIPDPPKEGSWTSAVTAPNWVMPMAFAAANGHDHERAINGIGFSEPEGDLLLYRRFTADDWERYPMLYGISEAWIVFALSGGN